MEYVKPNIVYPKYPSPQSQMAIRNASQIVEAIVHHSDGAPGQTPLEIDAEHRAENWAMIGYSYVIGQDGTIYKGRPDLFVPSAAYGENTQSIDICLTGDFQPGTPNFQSQIPGAQLNALKALLVFVHRSYPNITRTIGHRDVAKDFPDDPGQYSTACPGDVLENMLPALRTYVQEAISLDGKAIS